MDASSATRRRPTAWDASIIAERASFRGKVEAAQMGFDALDIGQRGRRRCGLGDPIVEMQQVGPGFGREDDGAADHRRSLSRSA